MSPTDDAALRALVAGYAIAADERDGAGFAALFTEDAVLAVVGADGTEHRHVGAVAIGEVPAKLRRFDETLHLLSTHRCEIDGDTATGVAYCEAHHRSGPTDRVLYIRYDDRYVRTPAGWRIQHRTVRTRWVEQRRIDDGR